MQEGCDIVGLLCNSVRSGSYAGRLRYCPFYLIELIEEALMQGDCDNVVSGVALMQEGCDIIDILCYGVRSGSYVGMS